MLKRSRRRRSKKRSKISTKKSRSSSSKRIFSRSNVKKYSSNVEKYAKIAIEYITDDFEKFEEPSVRKRVNKIIDNLLELHTQIFLDMVANNMNNLEPNALQFLAMKEILEDYVEKIDNMDRKKTSADTKLIEYSVFVGLVGLCEYFSKI